MKKALILIIAAVYLLQINGLSQKAQVGLTGGVTFSNLVGSSGGGDLRNDSRAGFTLGMIVEAPIGKSRWSFQPGLHYVQKGAFTKKTPSVNNAIALRYADLHANFIHYTKGTKSNRLFFGLGPSLGLNLPSKSVIITDESKSETTLSFGKKTTDNFRGVDWGANAIIGIRFNCGVIAALNYTYGLRNQLPIPKGDDAIRNSCLGIRLGYIFRNVPKK